MDKIVFVTGTDTDAGKTVISCALLEYYRLQGINVAPMKPISAGASYSNSELCNDDALQLIEAAKTNLPYKEINPYVFEEPIAPHIAAQKTNQTISSYVLTDCLKNLKNKSERVVIEGAGGWQVPINNEETLADWVRALKCPVILVVGLRVGCINHALLSYADIIKGPNRLLGWVANTMSPDVNNIDEITEYLNNNIQAPLLGTVPYLLESDRALNYIDFSLLDD